ncbi:hypothetical protein STEG23_023348 [Scotinomys teguina]
MTVMPLGRDQDCSLKNREPDVLAPWFLDPGGWSKTAAVRLYFIFPGICTLSLDIVSLYSFGACPGTRSVDDKEEPRKEDAGGTGEEGGYSGSYKKNSEKEIKTIY